MAGVSNISTMAKEKKDTVTLIIDAKGLILGRMASYAASQAMLGQDVAIVNCEEAIISGKKESIIKKYQQRMARGSIRTGPFHPRPADRIVRRVVRGMLDYNSYHGRKAFQRVMCYCGVPSDFAGKAMTVPQGMDAGKLPVLKFVKVKDICKVIGG